MGNTGPLGQHRGLGMTFLLWIVTFGFYGWYWAYKTHRSCTGGRGRGLGEVLGLVIWILITPVSGFVIPSRSAGCTPGTARRTP